MRIEQLRFDPAGVESWSLPSGQHSNWPVVYVLNGGQDVYVGETVNASMRLRQHLKNPEKSHLDSTRVVIDDTFNKSACLDLESRLISLFAGDGTLNVLNRNDGITNADYYDRARYLAAFDEIFEQLKREGLFSKSVTEIVNSDLFKLSPFKALNEDQQVAVVDILEGLFADIAAGEGDTVVVRGGPGTGKTIVAVFLIKMLTDIASVEPGEDAVMDSVFADFFVEDNRAALANFRMALVVPQQSLLASIRKVFRRVPGLDPSMVVSPHGLVKTGKTYDLVLVDEAHRLGRYGSSTGNKEFGDTSKSLAREGEDWRGLSQLDWVMRRSTRQVLFLDERQTVRPLDLSRVTTEGLLRDSSARYRQYPLRSQMRVKAGSQYLEYVDRALSSDPDIEPRDFTPYDLRFFDDLGHMRDEILAREQEHGLARLVAGYAWPWVSKAHPEEPDIHVDGLELFWNRKVHDWINSPGSVDEVGSIHTVQGYDLNYAGVIIGPDLRWDRASGALAVDRDEYHDRKGKQGSKILGVELDDAALLELVRNIYRVLLTRGILGTYVYVCDPALRERLRPFFT